MSFESDYLIVGAGTAGSVLAARLSEDPLRRIHVLEAGPDVRPGEEPEDIRNIFPMSQYNPAYSWPALHAHWLRKDTSPVVPIQQGRVVGGGSAIMGMMALRGIPDDYDGWRRAGALGWGWDDVLPYFRRLETDCDFDGPLHGENGPIPVRREGRHAWTSFAKAVHRASNGLGYSDIEDMNGEFDDGHCVLPLSRYEDRRASAGICYLTAEVRARPNLHMFTNITVTRLIVEDKRVVGVEAIRSDGSTVQFRSSETILTAGALQSPLLLMRSGIGPGHRLQQAGVPVIADRTGVGENLQTHPILLAFAFLAGASRDAKLDKPPVSTFLRWSSMNAAGSPADMSMYIRSYVTWHAIGRRMGMLAPVLARPNSRGRVCLCPERPFEKEIIEFNLLADSSDLIRLMDGMRLAFRIFSTPELQAVAGESMVSSNLGALMRLNRKSPTNALVATLASCAMDCVPRLGRRLLDSFAGTTPLGKIISNDEALSDFIHQSVTGTYHLCGTTRMGDSNDPMTVVAPNGRVLEIDGLRVADASIMPQVVSGNTHIPVAMIGEKIASAIRKNG